MTGDAHSLPTPSLSDKVEPLQKATKGKITIIIYITNFVALRGRIFIFYQAKKIIVLYVFISSVLL